MAKLTAHKIGEWSGEGQFRTILLSSDRIFLVGGVNPVSGPRSHFQAIAVSLDIQEMVETWRVVVDKSKPFEQAALHGRSLFATVPHNFTRTFTGYIEIDTANGNKVSQREFEEVIVGVVSINNRLFFATALRGDYRVFSLEDEKVVDFPWERDFCYWLEAIVAIGNDRLVISAFDRASSKLTYVHSAFTLNGEFCWKIKSPFLNIATVVDRLIVWDGESAATEIYDSNSGKLISVLELAGYPLESPIAIGNYGFAYACPDCSIHIRGWEGSNQQVFQKQTSGSIALAHDNSRNILISAFSGNNKETNTQVTLLDIRGI